MAFEMRREGTLVPTLFGRPYHEAMPLAAWAPLAVADLQGEVTPLSGRFLPALAALGMVGATLVLAWRHGSSRIGVLAGAAVTLNYLVAKYGRESRIDPVLGFGVLAAIASFFHASVKGRRAWFVVSGVGLALAVAAKGPMAAALVAAAVLPWLVFERRGKEAALGGAIALAVGAALTAAWLLPYRSYLGEKEFAAFYDQMVNKETLEKAFDTGGYGKAEPLWRYFEWLSYDFGPWIVPAAFALVRILRAPRSATSLERLAASWALGPLLALSAASGKVPRYLVPLVPGLAVLAAFEVARWLDFARRRADEYPPPSDGLAVFLAFAGGLAALAGIAGPVAIFALEDASPWAVATGFATVAGGAFAVASARRRAHERALVGLYVAAAAALLFYDAAVLPLEIVQRRQPYYRLACDLSSLVPASEPLTLLDGRDPSDHEAIDHAQLGLHLGRWVERGLPGKLPERGLVLSREPSPGFRLVAEVAWYVPPHTEKEAERWFLLSR